MKINVTEKEFDAICDAVSECSAKCEGAGLEYVKNTEEMLKPVYRFMDKYKKENNRRIIARVLKEAHRKRIGE